MTSSYSPLSPSIPQLLAPSSRPSSPSSSSSSSSSFSTQVHLLSTRLIALDPERRRYGLPHQSSYRLGLAKLESSVCRGQFKEGSPWSRTRTAGEIEEDSMRGIPRDMKEWEEWEKEKKAKGKGREVVSSKEGKRKRINSPASTSKTSRSRTITLNNYDDDQDDGEEKKDRQPLERPITSMFSTTKSSSHSTSTSSQKKPPAHSNSPPPIRKIPSPRPTPTSQKSSSSGRKVKEKEVIPSFPSLETLNSAGRPITLSPRHLSRTGAEEAKGEEMTEERDERERRESWKSKEGGDEEEILFEGGYPTQMVFPNPTPNHLSSPPPTSLLNNNHKSVPRHSREEEPNSPVSLPQPHHIHPYFHAADDDDGKEHGEEPSHRSIPQHKAFTSTPYHRGTDRSKSTLSLNDLEGPNPISSPAPLQNFGVDSVGQGDEVEGGGSSLEDDDVTGLRKPKFKRLSSLLLKRTDSTTSSSQQQNEEEELAGPIAAEEEGGGGGIVRNGRDKKKGGRREREEEEREIEEFLRRDELD